MNLLGIFVGPNSQHLEMLKLIGLRKTDAFPARYRDTYISENGHNVVVLTRTGGPNRKSFVEANHRLTRLDGYVGDFDDPWDETFAHFTYRPHNDALAAVAELRRTQEHSNPLEVLKAFMEDLKADKDTPQTKAARDHMQAVMNEIQAAVESSQQNIALLDDDFPTERIPERFRIKTE